MKNFMITIFSDASHCQQTRASGFGAWVKRGDWQNGKTFGGPIIGASNASEAELLGIVAAVKAVAAIDGLASVDALMIQCDSTQALSAILSHKGLRVRFKASADKADVGGPQMGRRTVISRLERDALDEFVELVGDRWIYLRHVKGHRQQGTTRHAVNDICDTIAGKHMRSGRAAALGAVAP